MKEIIIGQTKIEIDNDDEGPVMIEISSGFSCDFLSKEDAVKMSLFILNHFLTPPAEDK